VKRRRTISALLTIRETGISILITLAFRPGVRVESFKKRALAQKIRVKTLLNYALITPVLKSGVTNS